MQGEKTFWEELKILDFTWGGLTLYDTMTLPQSLKASMNTVVIAIEVYEFLPSKILHIKHNLRVTEFFFCHLNCLKKIFIYRIYIAPLI